MEDIKAPSLAPMVSVPRRIQCHLLSLWLFFFKRRAEGQFAAAKPLLLPHGRFIHTTMNHLRQVRRTVRESVTLKSLVRSLALVPDPL